MSSRATSIAMTSPLAPTSIPRTPVVSRPMERASDSAKRTVRPARETMMISSCGSTPRTASSSSSSRTLMAMIPSALIGVLYAGSSVFLTVPRRVAKTRYLASLKSRVDTTAWMRSPSRRGRMLTSARPLAVRDASGSS